MPRLKNKIKLETALPPKLINLDMKLIETLAGKGLTERQIGLHLHGILHMCGHSLKLCI